jgi:hypothetical protein
MAIDTAASVRRESLYVVPTVSAKKERYVLYGAEGMIIILRS